MKKAKLTYRELLAELNQLVADMQSGHLGIDEALVKYQEGQRLLAELTAYVERAENEIVVHRPPANSDV